MDFSHLTSLFALDAILQSEGFVIGYYVFTVATSLILVKETKKRIYDLKKGIKSIKFAPLTFGIVLGYVFLVYPYVDSIPVWNFTIHSNLDLHVYSHKLC